MELKDKLEFDAMPTYEGTVFISINFDTGNYMKQLKTAKGDYEVLTSKKTTYKGLDVSERGVIWHTGKRYKIKGQIH